MTTSIVTCNSTIVRMLLTHKASKQTRDRYKLNTHHITVLLGCYVYCKNVKSSFALYPIRAFISFYSHYRLVNYINRLVSIGMITLAGARYSISSLGVQAVEEIADNSNSNLYSFCSKYNIEL